jgi:hypothetical protein
MMDYVKIKSSNNLVRDMNSGAVINTNKAEYENYLARRKTNAEVKQQLRQNSDDISCIKNELSEVKEMLLTLIKQESN